MMRAATCGRTATSSSSRPRPATTCGRARTASGARASTCSRASTRACSRMGLDYVDIFYSHRFDPETPLEETMGALDTAVRQGKALYVGISSYSAEKTREAAGILRELGTPCLIHQPSYSMLNRWIEAGAARRAGRARASAASCFSPLAQGMLTDKYLDGIPEGSRASRAELASRRTCSPTEALEKIRALNEIAAEARAEPGPDGARVGAARPAHHLGARSAQAAWSSSRRTSAALDNLDFTHRRAGGDRQARDRQRNQPLGRVRAASSDAGGCPAPGRRRSGQAFPARDHRPARGREDERWPRRLLP